MMYSNSFSGLAFGWHLHFIFGSIALIGAVMFILWTYKHLDKKSMKEWTMWLLIVGILGTFLTGGWGMRGWQSMMGSGSGYYGMMQYLDDYEEFDTAEEWREYMLEEMEEHMGF